MIHAFRNQFRRIGWIGPQFGQVPNPDNMPTQPLPNVPPLAPMPTNPVVPKPVCPPLLKSNNSFCYAYTPTEIAVSKTEAGQLTPDVVLVQPTVGPGMLNVVVTCRYLIIRDFGVTWRHLKTSTINEPLFKSSLALFEVDKSLIFRIVGYSDCVGPESKNLFYRRGRARNVFNLFGPSARSRVMASGPAPAGIFLTDNSTVTNIIDQHLQFTSISPASVFWATATGWHWVLVQRSPKGLVWASDPLRGSGVRRISSADLGSRYELIVDAQSNKPITAATADTYKK